MKELLDHELTLWAKKLQLPTNPGYDFEADPTDQPEYVNPVTLNNYLPVYGNAQGQIADFISQKNARIAQLKKEQREKQYALDDFEEEILRKFPPDKDRYIKTLKLQAAYIATRAAESGRGVEHKGMIIALRAIENDIELLKGSTSTAALWIKTIEDNTVKIQTHLSFVKAEADRVKRFG